MEGIAAKGCAEGQVWKQWERDKCSRLLEMQESEYQALLLQGSHLTDMWWHCW